MFKTRLKTFSVCGCVLCVHICMYVCVRANVKCYIMNITVNTFLHTKTNVLWIVC